VAQGEETLIDGIAARVNAHAITVSAVMSRAQPELRRFQGELSGRDVKAKMRAAYTNALQELIEHYLILDEYDKQKGRVPDWIIEQRIGEIIKDKFNGDRLALMETLERDGLSYESWRDEVRSRFIVTSMERTQVDDHVRVSPTEARGVYNRNVAQYVTPARVKLRMILLKRDAPPPGLDTVRQRLGAGEEFAAVAKEVSKDPKAASGGDWGWKILSDLRPELVDALRKARAANKAWDAAEIAGENEIYVFKLEEWADEAAIPYEQALPDIERELRKQETDRLHNAWIDRLRDEGYVKVFDVDVFR
jgi:peptidyl-prolyl cis-trans isomerase SurA